MFGILLYTCVKTIKYSRAYNDVFSDIMTRLPLLYSCIALSASSHHYFVVIFYKKNVKVIVASLAFS